MWVPVAALAGLPASGYIRLQRWWWWLANIVCESELQNRTQCYARVIQDQCNSTTADINVLETVTYRARFWTFVNTSCTLGQSQSHIRQRVVCVWLRVPRLYNMYKISFSGVMFTVRRLVRVEKIVSRKVFSKSRYDDTFDDFGCERQVGDWAVIWELILIQGGFLDERRYRYIQHGRFYVHRLWTLWGFCRKQNLLLMTANESRHCGHKLPFLTYCCVCIFVRNISFCCGTSLYSVKVNS